jgi:hypothetical protein
VTEGVKRKKNEDKKENPKFWLRRAEPIHNTIGLVSSLPNFSEVIRQPLLLAERENAKKKFVTDCRS